MTKIDAAENTTAQNEFAAGLLTQWIAQQAEVNAGTRPEFEFRGLTGMDYNGWIEHRHGWPLTPEGLCGVSLSSWCCDEHDDGEEVPWQECPTCSVIVKWFEEEQGK
jgi:hypothetical protein